MNKMIFLIFVTIFIGGCSFKDVSQPIKRYDLQSVNTKKVNYSSDKVLKVAHFKSPINLQGDKIWYQVKSLRLGAYLYSSWNQNFSSMVEQQLSSSIFKSGLFKSLFTNYSKAKADFVLEGEVVNALQIVGKDNSKVVFEIRLYLINSKNHKIVGSKEFAYAQKCKRSDAIGAIKAYNEIVKVFDKEVILWLKRLAKGD